MKKIFLLLLLFLLIFSNISIIAAEETAEKAVSKDTKQNAFSWISNGAKLGKWWLRRSRDYTAPNAILFHSDIKYSLNNETGNEELTKHKLNVSLILRKDICTNYLSFNLKKKDMDYRGSVIKNESQKFEDTVFIEILPFMDFMTTFEWETNDKKYYLNHYTYSGGLYFTLLNTKQVIFKIGGFYGHDNIEYMNELSELMGKKQEDYDKDYFRIYQRSTFLLSDIITFSEKLNYNSYAGNNGYDLELNLNCNVKITRNISLDTSYDIERDATEGNSALEKEDQELSVGIKISF